VWLNEFDLLDAVLQDAHSGVVVTQCGNHIPAWPIWVALTANSTSSTGCPISPGS
jgi:hypothetical protein